jgi:hypothetical protein
MLRWSSIEHLLLDQGGRLGTLARLPSCWPAPHTHHLRCACPPAPPTPDRAYAQVFLAGVPREASEAQLRELCSLVGKVYSIRLPRDPAMLVAAQAPAGGEGAPGVGSGGGVNKGCVSMSWCRFRQYCLALPCLALPCLALPCLASRANYSIHVLHHPSVPLKMHLHERRYAFCTFLDREGAEAAMTRLAGLEFPSLPGRKVSELCALRSGVSGGLPWRQWAHKRPRLAVLKGLFLAPLPAALHSTLLLPLLQQINAGCPCGPQRRQKPVVSWQRAT